MSRPDLSLLVPDFLKSSSVTVLRVSVYLDSAHVVYGLSRFSVMLVLDFAHVSLSLYLQILSRFDFPMSIYGMTSLSASALMLNFVQMKSTSLPQSLT